LDLTGNRPLSLIGHTLSVGCNYNKRTAMQQANEFRNIISKLLNDRKYDVALQELNSQSDDFINNKKDDLYLLAEIASSYIDLGSESYNLDAVNKGISIFKDNYDLLKLKITSDSIDYCLGNGFHAIYKISIKGDDNFFPTPVNVSGPLFEAKQSYLKAFKKIDFENLNDYSIQVLTNLGNNLNHSGRIVEALQLFDTVLEHNPEFPQALGSKADGLLYMIRATNCALTISLFAKIYWLFKKAKENANMSEEIEKSVEYGINKSAEFLMANGFDFTSLEKDHALDYNEYLNHPDNIKFFLDNFLSLSEHGLYCKCNGAKIDDLRIGFPGYKSRDIKLAELELLNNRLKSEFSFARQLYFDFLTSNLTDNVHYEDVLFGISNGIQIEQLRTSFRLCFGILDKIAEGLCYLLDIETAERENIYFESFWHSKQIPSRWGKINSFRNIHLTALYSIACDLNKKDGEFGFYKMWRNRLEHGLFSLTSSEYQVKKWQSKRFMEKATEENFEKQTKYLLQLTRAAIFSFVFCVRKELINEKNGNS
jgi:tetratricopeptide (TPR) repeat protein